MSALEFNGVRKAFGPVVALEHLDVVVEQGELIALLGPSGCGKTTALRIAAGFERPDAGRVVVKGVEITHQPAHKRNMGMVFQSYSLFPNMSVGENVEFGLRTRKVAGPERTKRVGEVLELVQLAQLADRYPHQLSGGQQQRVALARALAFRPEVLLLDEPLSALDAKVRGSLRDEIRRLQTELGITTLFVTHDQEEALAISDRVGVMSNGLLEQLASPREVYRRPSNAFVARFVGSMNDLPATVLGPDCVSVGDYRVSIPAAADRPVGRSVRLLVRPEDLDLAAASSKPDSAAGPGRADGPGRGDGRGDGLAGIVQLCTFQGASTVVGVRLTATGSSVSVHTSGAESVVSPGDAVRVVIDGTRAVCEATS